MADQQTPETWMAMKNLRLITNPITLKLRQRNANDTCRYQAEQESDFGNNSAPYPAGGA